MAGQLAHVGDVFINFRNRTFQWVHIKRFRLPGAATDDRRALSLLLEHDLYGDNYAGGDPGEDPSRHGPYWRDRIMPESFEQTDAGVEENRLRAWAEEHAKLADHLRDDLERVLYQPLRAATTVYRLRDLGQAACHDWGQVLGPLHELVLLDRTRAELVLAVASDD